MSNNDPVYHYISSPDYVDQLKFDHIETYSFQRGGHYDELDELLNSRKKGGQLNDEQRIRYNDLIRFPRENGFLFDENGQVTKSAVRINIFKAADPETEKILAILTIPAVDTPAWMCGPFYRDAIVFYNAFGQIISVLNICFSCQYMETKKLNYINADEKVYHQLKQLFLSIGHPVED